MSIQLPPEIDESRSFLTREAGMSMAGAEQIGGFGNGCMVMTGGIVQVRFTGDRGQWNVEVAPTGSSGEWYDMLVLREMLTGLSRDEPLPLAQEVKVLRGNWSTVLESFSPARLSETKRTLQKLMDDRARRMFPGWYQ